jgi:dihydroceramidase
MVEPATALSHSLSRPGYWGPVTSSLDWCEPNYVVSHYIAEFWNSLSNAFFIALGLFGAWHAHRHGFERRFVAMYLGVTLIGIGSTAFHASLRHFQQQSDETPMVWYVHMRVWSLQSAPLSAGALG